MPCEESMNNSFLLAGVGGQGIVLASDILAEVGMEAGYDVKKSEIHGMAQRGGSVVSHVRWGSRVWSPLAPKGEVDYLLAFELLESLRWLDYLRPEGVAIVNEQRLPPLSVISGEDEYPSLERVKGALTEAAREFRILPALAWAEALGSPRVLNVVLLGALSIYLGVEPEVWLTVIGRQVPPQFVGLNIKAFEAGRTLIS